MIDASLKARFTVLASISGRWPCDYPAAQGIKLKVAKSAAGKVCYPDGGLDRRGVSGGQFATPWTELDPSEIQDLGDVIPGLLAIRSKTGCPISFRVRIEFGDRDHTPSPTDVAEINQILNNLKSGFTLK